MNIKMKKFNLIFLNTGVLILSSKEYNSWNEIQDEYQEYSSSIAFDSLEEVKEYIILDYKLTRDFVENLITNFISSKLMTISLDF